MEPAAVAAGLGVLAGAGAAWAVRGRSSSVFADSVWHGDKSLPQLALTFDDGPSEATLEIAAELENCGGRGTFFQCGANAERLPEVSRELARRGHEIGNHTWSHTRLDFMGAARMRRELGRTQTLLAELAGAPPRLFRAPYGVRWPGLGGVQKQFGLLGVMWTVIGRDWKLDAEAVSARLMAGASRGAILCLHDGRELAARPDVRQTLEAVRLCLPQIIDLGFQLVPVSAMLKKGETPHVSRTGTH